jgi:hypothetical protein
MRDQISFMVAYLLDYSGMTPCRCATNHLMPGLPGQPLQGRALL